MPTKNQRVTVTLSAQTAISLNELAQGEPLNRLIENIINERLASADLPNETLPPRGEVMRTANPRKRK